MNIYIGYIETQREGLFSTRSDIFSEQKPDNEMRTVFSNIRMKSEKYDCTRSAYTYRSTARSST